MNVNGIRGYQLVMETTDVEARGLPNPTEDPALKLCTSSSLVPNKRLASKT